MLAAEFSEQEKMRSDHLEQSKETVRWFFDNNGTQ